MGGVDKNPLGEFYLSTIERLLKDGVMSRDDRILVICAGMLDRDVFHAAGFTDVVISNLDVRIKERAEASDEFAPFSWAFRDAERIEEEDGSFAFVVVHGGLHHCYSPHRGLAEMNRVASKGVLLLEPRDGWFTRLGVRLGFGQEYEAYAVFGNDMKFGGVANTEIPNYVYRFGKREIQKTFRCLNPEGTPRLRFFHAIQIPWRFAQFKNPFLKFIVAIAKPVLFLLGKVFPSFCNNFGCLALKPELPRDLHPWLVWEDGHAQINKPWLEDRYSDDGEN